MESKQPVSKNPEFQHTEDFSSVYANHTFMEPSVWDLKILFGELDQSFEPLVIDQHTAVTLPWMHAKVFLYYLRLQLAAQEINNGNIALPLSVTPPAINPPTDTESNPVTLRIYEEFKRIRQEMFPNE